MRQTTPDLTPTPLPPLPALRVLGGTRRGSKAAAAPLAEDVERPRDPAVGPAPRLVDLLAHLRVCVTRHVTERRAAGAPLDRVLLEVRSLVREAEACEGWLDASETLMAQVAWWSINAYDDEPELQHVPRFY